MRWCTLHLRRSVKTWRRWKAAIGGSTSRRSTVGGCEVERRQAPAASALSFEFLIEARDELRDGQPRSALQLSAVNARISRFCPDDHQRPDRLAERSNFELTVPFFVYTRTRADG